MTRSLIATLLGLGAGWLAFLIALIVILVPAGDPNFESEFLFFAWFWLPIPLLIFSPFLALGVVWPVAVLFDQVEANHSSYLAYGTLIGGLVGGFVLAMLGAFDLPSTPSDVMLFLFVPEVASGMAGLTTGESLYRARLRRIRAMKRESKAVAARLAGNQQSPDGPAPVIELH